MSKKEGGSQLAAPQQPVEKQSPLSLPYAHPREHQLLVQSGSAHVTPKRKTERVLSAPGIGAGHTRVSSGVSSSVSSAQFPPQSQHAQLGGAALASSRRQAPHQPATAPTNRMMKAPCARAGSSVNSGSPAPCPSTAHGKEESILWHQQGAEMSSIPEKIELNLLSPAAPRTASPVAAWDVSSMERRSSPYSADNSAFQHDGRPKAVENPSRIEPYKGSAVGAAASPSVARLPTERYTGTAPTANTSFSFVGTNPSPGPRVSPSTGVGFQASPGARTNSPAVTEALLSSPARKQSGEHSPELRGGFSSKSSTQSPSLCLESLSSCSHGATQVHEVDFQATHKTTPVSEKSSLISSPVKKGDEKVVNVVLRNDTKEHRIKLVSQGSTSRTSVSTTGEASPPGKKSTTSETSLSPFEEAFVEPGTNPVRPLSLQSNITLHIKPEAIYSGVPRPAHTALQMEFESLNTPRKTMASVRSSPQATIPPESENKDVCIDIFENSPLKKVDSKPPGKKATSFLTELLSQSSSRRSSKASSGLLKFWGGSKLKNKKQEFGSTVAMAGSNSSNSDSTASELSENSSLNKGLLESNLLKSEHKPLPRSGLCNEYYDASGAKNGQYPSIRHDSNSSSLAYGESSSLLASAEPVTSSSLWLSGKLPWRSGALNARPSQNNPVTSGQSTQAREPDFVVPDAEQDDDEAWFDSVTKLNEQWFKPGAMTSLPGSEGPLLKDRLVMASADTPVGKSDMATLRGVTLFDGLGFGDGKGTLTSAHNSIPNDLLNLKTKQLGSNNSYGSLNTPMNKTAMTYKSFGTISGQNQNVSLSELSSHPGSGPQSALRGKYRSPLASSMGAKYELAGSNSGSGPSLSTQTNLRKQLHTRARLLRPQLQRKAHTSLMKTNIDDAGAVKEIEAGLLRLMEQFQAGNLTAFGHDSRLRQMEAIREQQESLAKLHQEVGGSQDLYQPLSTEALRINEENMSTLMGKLACLSVAIEKLECNTAPDRKSSQAGQQDDVKSPSDPAADQSRSSEGVVGSTFTAGDGSCEDGLDGVVLRRKRASALLQKSVSLGKNPSAAGDIEMIKIRKNSSVARSSSQKHYDHKSGIDATAVCEGNERSSRKDADTPVRPASALAFESLEMAPGNVPDSTTQHRHRQHHHRHHRHSQDDQKHTGKRSNKESIAKADGAVLVDQSSPKIESGGDATEMRHFDSRDVGNRSPKRKRQEGVSRSAVSVQVSCTDADLVPTQKQPPTLPARPSRPLPSPVPPSKQLPTLPTNQGPSAPPPSIPASGQPLLSDPKRRPPSLSDSKTGPHSLVVSKSENLSPVTKPGSSPLLGTHKVFVPASKQNPCSQPLLTNAKDASAISYRSTASAVPTTTLRTQTSFPSQSKGISLQTTTYPYPHSRTIQASPIFHSDNPSPVSYTRHQTAPILPGYGSTTHSSMSTPPVASVSTTPSFYTQTRASYNSTSLISHTKGPSISSSTSNSRSQTPVSSAASSLRAPAASSFSSRTQTYSPAPTHAALPYASSTVVTVDSSGTPAVSCAHDRSSKKVSTEKTSLISGNPHR